MISGCQPMNFIIEEMATKTTQFPLLSQWRCLFLVYLCGVNRDKAGKEAKWRLMKFLAGKVDQLRT